MWTLFAAVSLLLTSCGMPDVSSNKKYLVARDLQNFTKQNIRLTNSKFFLWKENTTSEDISRSMALSNELEALDAEALPINLKKEALLRQIDPLKERSRWLSGQLRPLRTLYNFTKKKSEETKTLRDEAQTKLDQEKAKPLPDPNVIEKLCSQIEAYDTALSTFNSQLMQLGSAKLKLETEIDSIKTNLDPLLSGKELLESQQMEIIERGQKKIEEITQLVDWFREQPTSVSIQFAVSGSTEVAISGWNPGSDTITRTYSTNAETGKQPTIQNVKYSLTGGVLSFDVVVFQGAEQKTTIETYSFRLARSSYDDSDGRTTFTGDILRRKDGQVKRGFAKLKDRNN